MNLIVGLGNPGEKYRSTRHNIGFMVVDHVEKDILHFGKAWEFDKSSNALILKKGDLIFVKPQTFMNASGAAVKRLVNFYKIPLGNVWVVHDDIDLPLGKIRIRTSGGSAGHHGIESIIRELGKDTFVRFRLGVGKGVHDEKRAGKHNLLRQAIEKYVVSKFRASEAGQMRTLIKHAAKAIELALHKGLDKAMNQYN